MAGLGGFARRPSLQLLPSSNNKFRSRGFHCCSNVSNGKRKEERETPALLEIAVGGVTELLRFFSPAHSKRAILVDNERENETWGLSVDEVLSIIKSDYENAYFVTGHFTSVIYAEDCTFEDPTIKFQGRELYARNLSLLVPFFDNPSIHLKEIKKGPDSEKSFIVASWSLRTYLNLPWKPLVSVDGKTIYDLDEEFKIIRHVERWNISALEAIAQIFTPNL